MASREGLVRIGKEGFDIIDQLYENKGRKGGASARKPPPHALPKGREACLYQYQPHQSHVYMVNPYEKTKTHDVVQLHDGKTPYLPQRQGPERGTRRASIRLYKPEQNPLHLINPKASGLCSQKD